MHEVKINEDKILMQRYVFDIPVLFLWPQIGQASREPAAIPQTASRDLR